MTLAVLLLQLALAQGPARALAAPEPAQSLLAVPFVAQTPELCGGAAVSMVMRYWGQREVFPQDFASLVSQDDGGIFTGVLAKSVSDRGWTALVEPASSDTGRARFRAEIDRGRPIIALIEVSPRTYHYVVVVASTDLQVVFHDPARGPFRVMDWMRFNVAWAAANYWMMVALPPSGFVARPADTRADSTTNPSAVSAAPSTPCSGLVAHAVKTALDGDARTAELELIAAMRLCPQDPAGWREMAGLRFSKKRYAEANALATAATRLAPGDEYSWELAATSRYLSGDSSGALAAWNRIGQPRVDAINIRGAERTHLPVIVGAAGLEPRMLLTPAVFSKSLRRLRDLPVASTASIKFEPAAGGLANVDVVVVERSAFPRGRRGLVMLAARSAAQAELRVDVAGLSGAGESAYAAWRFRERRPRVSLGLAFPSPQWLPGVTTFSGMWEEQSYAFDEDPFRETRRRAGLQVSDWASGWLKWQAGAAMDSFNGTGHFAADASLLAMSPGDRAAITVSGARWLPFLDGPRFFTAAARASLRSTADPSRAVFSSSIDVHRASADAPLALWPGAGASTGGGRAALLRGHRLIDRGVIAGDVLGRRLISATAEYAQPVRTIRTLTISIAGFVDAARASERREGRPSTQVLADVGVGLRLRFPGGLGGLRVDVAHPLGRGRAVLSVGWINAWPR